MEAAVSVYMLFIEEVFLQNKVFLFVLFCFILSWKKKKKERSDSLRPRLREPCRCGLGSPSALPPGFS